MNVTNRFGPGFVVAAAFIGPGTVTTATLAGAGFGYSLVWVLLFSILATVVLQEMSARLGLVTRAGLGEALRASWTHPFARAMVVLLVVSAIGAGTAAYQTGNITGAAMAMTSLTSVSAKIWAPVIAAMATALLWAGHYKILERALVVLVALMSVVFMVSAIYARPDYSAMFRGAVRPGIPHGAWPAILSLIGTTVVPYNLFLHASSVREKWSSDVPLELALRRARVDTVVAVAFGGAVTLAIMVTAAAFFQRGMAIENAADMARQLEPLLGSAARWFFAGGLMAAGLTSAITAPMAAAYATAGVLGWTPDLRSARLRGVWLSVMLVGVVFAVWAGRSPVETIVFAQVANGLILPVLAVFLIIVVNRKALLSKYTNGTLSNVLGVLVVVVVSGLALYKLAAKLL